MFKKKNTVKPIKSVSVVDRLVLENGGRAELVNQEELGNRPCYDLEVDHQDHLFILANGIIVSNSSKHTCLDEDTLVTLGDGFKTKKIKDLIPMEDYVLGSDTHGNLKPVKVLQVFDQGYQPCFKWSFRANKKDYVDVVCTSSHKFLTKSGDVLPLKTYVSAPKSYKKFYAKFPASTACLQGSIHEPLALIAGIFMGDGIRFTGSNSVRFSCADPLLIEYLNSLYFKGKDLSMVKRKRSYDYSIVDHLSNLRGGPRDNLTGQFIKGTKHRVKAMLKRLGWEGKYCWNKTIPDEILEWDNNSIIDFIKGYFVTDGSIFISKSGQIAINFGSTSYEILDTLKHIFINKFGIRSASITHTTCKRKRILYQLGIYYYSEIKKFLDIFTDIPGIKGLTIKKLYPIVAYNLESNKRHTIPSCSLISFEDVGLKHCYDIMVDHPDHLFKLECGLICSNSGMFKGRKTISGLPYIIQFLEGYESGKDKAAVSEFDGKVEEIKDAPQGGKYIVINGTEHYVEPNTEIFVKKGDEVERGDILSDGLANPADITRLRGIGEGRKYVAERFKKLLDDSGAKAHRRNTETFARGFIDKVRITNPDGLGDWLPDDIVSYNALEAAYTPEADSKRISVKNYDAVNKYLQRPVLHYTIGTKLTKKMVDHIRESGISDDVLVSDTEPSFTADFVRLREVPTQGEEDFIGRGVAPYQKANYIDAAVRGLQSNIKENTNPFTRISQPDFAENISRTGKF